MMSAPREMRWSATPKISMKRKVTASTSGIDSATTMPARTPRLTKLTPSTMTSASSSVFMNSLTERSTTRGWSATWWTSMPTGRRSFTVAMARSRSSPRASTLPPLPIETASPIAGSPR